MEDIWIVKAEYLRDYRLRLQFNDGLEGTVDLQNYLDKPIFQPLLDREYFKKFRLGSWTIGWENGADFAPEFLYEKCQKVLANS